MVQKDEKKKDKDKKKKKKKDKDKDREKGEKKKLKVKGYFAEGVKDGSAEEDDNLDQIIGNTAKLMEKRNPSVDNNFNKS